MGRPILPRLPCVICGVPVKERRNECCSKRCGGVLHARRYPEWWRKKLKTLKKELNPNWKGNNVGKDGLHGWVKRWKKKPKNCEVCGKQKRLDLANISQRYKRSLDDWEYICRRCHMTKDGRMERLRRHFK